jgi:hypothetical protein
VVKYDRSRQDTDDNITWRMGLEWRITKDTDTHSEYVILIDFPRQEWLSKRDSILRLHLYGLSC